MSEKTAAADLAAQERIETLSDEHPWPLIVQSVAGHIAWTPKRLTGLSKKSYFRKIIAATLEDLEVELDDTSCDALMTRVRRKVDEAVDASLRSERYAKPTNDGPIHPTETLRQLKYLDEYMLNAEFDLLMSILGGNRAAALLSNAIALPDAADWNYLGNTCDCIGQLNSMGISELQVDGLLYSAAGRYLLSPELKLSTAVGSLQLVKYASGFVAMEEVGLVGRGTRFGIVVIGEPEPRKKQGDLEIETARKRYLEKLASKPEAVKGRLRDRQGEVLDGLARMDLSYVSWQGFGDILSQERDHAVRPDDTTASNLISGFLRSLSKKYDLRRGETVYSPSQ